MNGYETLVRDIVEQNRRRMLDVVDQIRKRVDEISEGTIRKTYAEFGEYQQQRIQELFRDAVQQFYDAYTPAYYVRSESMYNMLDLQKNSDGLIAYDDAMDLIDRTKMTVDRKGGDLFNKVFVEGWHGGAEGINGALAERYGEHPSPGTPYYRTPHPYYTHWGMQSFRSESPFDSFQKSLQTEEGGSMLAELQRILEKHNKVDSEMAQKVIADALKNMH